MLLFSSHVKQFFLIMSKRTRVKSLNPAVKFLLQVATLSLSFLANLAQRTLQTLTYKKSILFDSDYSQSRHCTVANQHVPDRIGAVNALLFESQPASPKRPAMWTETPFFARLPGTVHAEAFIRTPLPFLIRPVKLEHLVSLPFRLQ